MTDYNIYMLYTTHSIDYTQYW